MLVALRQLGCPLLHRSSPHVWLHHRSALVRSSGRSSLRCDTPQPREGSQHRYSRSSSLGRASDSGGGGTGGGGAGSLAAASPSGSSSQLEAPGGGFGSAFKLFGEVAVEFEERHTYEAQEAAEAAEAAGEREEGREGGAASAAAATWPVATA